MFEKRICEKGDEMKYKERLSVYIGMIIVSVFIMIFFTSIHPLIIYDSDDWLYMSYRREAVPDIHEWNPSKVLPETLMPIVSDVGAHIIRPFVGDYLKSLTITYALVGTISILVLIGAVYMASKILFELGDIKAGVVSLFFLFLCFSIFRNDWSQNYYMFWARNVNCFFNYVIPGILNSVLAIYLLVKDKKAKKLSFVGLGFWFLLTYLAIYSNLFHSCILAVCVGVKLIFDANQLKKGLKDFWEKHIYEIVTIFLWLISLIFEGTGARASASGGFGAASVFNVAIGLIKKVIHMNKFSLVLVFVINLVSFVLLIKERKREGRGIIRFYGMSITSEVLLTVFLILLCSAVNSSYIDRSDAIFGFTFWILFITAMSLGYLMTISDKIWVIMPIIGYIFICNVLNAGRIYKNSNEMGMYYKKCIEVDNYIIEQALEADEEGLDKVTIKVPVGVDSVNWPHALDMGGRFANTLYQHGIISRYMDITIEPDQDVNEMFHLSY